MNKDQRTWQMDIAVKLMEEAVGDVLAEAHNDGETPLSPWDIHRRGVLWPDPHGSQVVSLVGKRMQTKGLIRNSGSETSPRWSPANA